MCNQLLTSETNIDVGYGETRIHNRFRKSAVKGNTLVASHFSCVVLFSFPHTLYERPIPVHVVVAFSNTQYGLW